MTRKVALVTGASRGIGRRIVVHFAERGWDVIMLARNGSAMRDLAGSLAAKHHVKCHVVGVDLCAFEEVRVQVNAILRQVGRLDVLVNAAGIFRFGTSSMSGEDLRAVLMTNVEAIHNMCSLCLEPLKQSGQARIFNVSSTVGLTGFAPVGGYAASKFAIVGYGQSLAKELLAAGVQVTTLCPDVVATDMGAGSGLLPEQMISTEDICRSIDFVMSLSPAAIVDQLTIQCREVLLRSEFRKSGAV